MKDLVSSSGETLERRIYCLNIRHGGGTKARRTEILRHVEAASADVVVLTEFRLNDAGREILARLAALGYAVTHPEIEPRRNTVLVASRAPIISAGPLLGRSESGKRLWVADLGWIRLCAVYMALGKEKQVFWDEIMRATFEAAQIDLYIGDFNTGSNTLDRAEGTTPFALPEYVDHVQAAGYADAWRGLHGERRAYSWISNRGGGFRLDHAFLRPGRLQATGCDYDHRPREERSTYHSALWLSLRETTGTGTKPPETAAAAARGPGPDGCPPRIAPGALNPLDRDLAALRTRIVETCGYGAQSARVGWLREEARMEALHSALREGGLRQTDADAACAAPGVTPLFLTAVER